MRIPDRETMTVEFKSVPSGGLSGGAVFDTVVGMSNAEGGTLYIGVDNDGRVTGVPASDKWADPVKVAAAVADNTVPTVWVDCDALEVEGRTVTRVRIPRSLSIVATKDGKVVRRRIKVDGTPENGPLYPHEQSSRLSDLKTLDFTARIHPEGRLSDLDPEERIRLRRIIRAMKAEESLLELDDEDFDKALGFVADGGAGELRPTVCGLLLMGRSDRLERLMPTAGAVFQALEGTDVVKNVDIRLPLAAALERIEALFSGFNRETEYREGLYRRAVPTYSERAFREALVNAFAHRDYARLGRVSVRLTDEGLEITSPGGFISGVTLENLLTIEPHGRNPRLADALKRIGLAERTGRGVDRIYEGSARYGRSWPDYSESSDEYVRLWIPNSTEDRGFMRMLDAHYARTEKKLSVLSLLILSALRSCRRLTTEALVRETRFPEARVRPAAERLVEAGLIARIGERRPYFVLSQEAYRNEGREEEFRRQTPQGAAEEADAMVLDLILRQGEAARSDLTVRLGISEAESRRVLQRLTDAGRIEPVGERRWRRYRLIG